MDALLVAVAYAPAWIGLIIRAGDSGGNTVATVLIVVGALLSLAVFVWNTCLRPAAPATPSASGSWTLSSVSDARGRPSVPGWRSGGTCATWSTPCRSTSATCGRCGTPSADVRGQIVHTVVLRPGAVGGDDPRAG